MTRIKEHLIRCSCGHEFSARLHESVNTQLSAEAVGEFLQGKLNRPECPSCHKEQWVMIPVLFNDMEREFMVWVGSREQPDGYVQSHEGMPSIVYTENYLAALAALVVFRAKPKNAAVAYEEMNAEKARGYIESFLQVYEELKTEATPTPGGGLIIAPCRSRNFRRTELT